MSWMPARSNMDGSFGPIFGSPPRRCTNSWYSSLIPFIGPTTWITKASREISVLDDDSSSRQARLHHGCETVLRLVQVREQKTGVSHIELLLSQAYTGI